MADDKFDQTRGTPNQTGPGGRKSPATAATDMARTAAGTATGMGQTATQAAQDMTRTGMNAATNMGQTAARAAQDMTRTAAGAATSMGQMAGQAASEMGRTAQAQGGGMMGTGMTGMGAMPGIPGMAEFTRLFSEMKMPAAPDMEQFLSAYRRNMEALSQANRVALEGAQSVARRHMEMMQQAMAEMTESMRQLASPESPQARTAKQAEMMKAAYERAVAHMREMADLIQRSNGEAVGLLNRRFTEAMDEVKAMAQKAGRS